MRAKQHYRLSHPFSAHLVLALCVTLPPLGGCDSVDDVEALEVTESIIETRDDERAARPTPPSGYETPSAAPDDECGLGGHEELLDMKWVEASDGLRLAVKFHETLDPHDDVEAHFRVTRMPVGPEGVRELGRPVSLAGDATIPLSSELVEAIGSGEAYAAFVLVRACRADDPHGNCLQYTSDELYIEDGRVMQAHDHEAFLREKWAQEKPWIFEAGHPTNIVSMKGQ